VAFTGNERKLEKYRVCQKVTLMFVAYTSAMGSNVCLKIYVFAEHLEIHKPASRYLNC